MLYPELLAFLSLSCVYSQIYNSLYLTNYATYLVSMFNFTNRTFMYTRYFIKVQTEINFSSEIFSKRELKKNIQHPT